MDSEVGCSILLRERERVERVESLKKRAHFHFNLHGNNLLNAELKAIRELAASPSSIRIIRTNRDNALASGRERGGSFFSGYLVPTIVGSSCHAGRYHNRRFTPYPTLLQHLARRWARKSHEAAPITLLLEIILRENMVRLVSGLAVWPRLCSEHHEGRTDKLPRNRRTSRFSTDGMRTLVRCDT